MAAFPVWEFRALKPNRPEDRQTHFATNGVMLMANDPFWQTAYPPYGFNCIPYSGKVVTVNGEKPIGEIEVGEVVLTGEGRWRPVEDVHVNEYDGQLVVLELEGDRVLKLTPNHRVMTVDRGWIEAGDLTETDRLVSGQEVFERPTQASIHFVCEPLPSHSSPR